jgi:transposase
VAQLSGQVRDLGKINRRLRDVIADQAARLAATDTRIAQLVARVEELERRLSQDSSSSSRPPSSDAPWSKRPARKRSSRTRSGREPGKQLGASSSSRSLVDDADNTLEITPDRRECRDIPLDGAPECGRQRRQVVDAGAAPPPKVTEYQRISKMCPW